MLLWFGGEMEAQVALLLMVDLQELGLFMLR